MTEAPDNRKKKAVKRDAHSPQSGETALEKNAQAILTKRLALLDEEKAHILAALKQLTKAGRFSTSLNKIGAVEPLLAQTGDKLALLLPLSAWTVYLVNEKNSNFSPAFAAPSETARRFAEEFAVLAEDYTFAWALNKAKPWFVKAKNGQDDLFVHALSTATRTRGLFIGLVDDARPPASDLALGLVPLICQTLAHELESIELYARIRTLNETLEGKVEARTKSLSLANDRLKAERERLKSAQKELVKAYGELKDAQDALIQNEKSATTGLLAAGIAHEIKNPLAVIVQGVEYLMKKSEDELVLDSSRRILAAALRADAVVRELLDYSRQSPADFAPIDSAKIAAEAIFLSAPKAKAKAVSIIERFDAHAPKIRADSGLLKQVFVNILLNAVDAAPPGGEIRVTVKDFRDEAGRRFGRFVFSDNGPGVPAALVHRIFDPFFTTKQGSGGTGLGLAVSKGIVERHKGGIEVVTKPGQGATFMVDIPAVRKRS